MKQKSIVRKVDELGRFIIPMEFRLELGIKEKDELNISIQDGKMILEKNKS